jgi:glycylpeptide N-tetradecanoyltransferase
MPTVAETLKHPAFPTAIWNLSPTRTGKLPVAAGRGGPFNISWEVHGSGPIKILVSVCAIPFIPNSVELT